MSKSCPSLHSVWLVSYVGSRDGSNSSGLLLQVEAAEGGHCSQALGNSHQIANT